MHGEEPLLASSRSILQHALEKFDLFAQAGVVAEFLLDLSDGVQDGGVVASAETAADFRQRAGREHLRQIHRDLARANHGGRAPLG